MERAGAKRERGFCQMWGLRGTHLLLPKGLQGMEQRKLQHIQIFEDSVMQVQ